jgi:conjugal transfer ATP-binding protein TraC
MDNFTLTDRFLIAKNKAIDKIKSAMINDTPPSVHHKNGSDAPTLAAMKAFSKRYSLSNLLPYEAFDQESGLYYNRDTVGFMLYVNPATGLSATELRVLNGFFNQPHKVDATIQVSLISDSNIEPILDCWKETKIKAVDKSTANIFDKLAQNRVDFLKNGKWDSLCSDQAFLLRNIHLVISYVIPIPKGMASIDLSDDEVKQLILVREATVGILRSAKMYAQNMPPDLFINIMNGLMNPSKQPYSQIYYDDNKLISSQIVDDDTMALFDSGASSLLHKDEAFSILPFHVRQFPQRWSGYKNGDLIGSFSNNIFRLPCHFIATLTVHCPDQVMVKGMVQRKSIRATQMSDSPLSRYVSKWKDRKIDWDYTAKNVDNGNKLVEAFYQIVLIMPEGREQECEQALKSVYESNGWVLSRSRYTPIHAFLGALPMGLCQELKHALKVFGHFSTMLSWTCTNVAPWIGEWKGTKTPMLLFSGRRGQLAFFDPFDNDKGNFNISCCATSGSGKSFLTQEWIFSCLGSGGRAFIIDAGHSYKNLCKLLNGTYLEFGNDEIKISLNPFSSINDEDPKYFKEQLPLLKMLIAQMASPEKPLSAKQRAVLEKAIFRTWNKYKSKATISTVTEELLSDNSDDGPMYSTAKDLAIMLHSYTKYGMYADYFEGESNVSLENYLIVLELDALSNTPDLQSVVLLILMMKITQVMYLSGNKTQRKLCIIDEAWRLLGRGRAGEFIEEGYRVARKHGGSFMTITQKISDYFTSETAKAAYMNSDFSVFLRQKPEELQSAEANGYIDNSDGKIDILRSLETIQGKYSELALSTPDGLAVLRFTVDPITEKLYSTKAEEVDYIRASEAKGIDIFDAVKTLIQRSVKR